MNKFHSKYSTEFNSNLWRKIWTNFFFFCPQIDSFKLAPNFQMTKCSTDSTFLCNWYRYKNSNSLWGAHCLYLKTIPVIGVCFKEDFCIHHKLWIYSVYLASFSQCALCPTPLKYFSKPQNQQDSFWVSSQTQMSLLIYFEPFQLVWQYL